MDTHPSMNRKKGEFILEHINSFRTSQYNNWEVKFLDSLRSTLAKGKDLTNNQYNKLLDIWYKDAPHFDTRKLTTEDWAKINRQIKDEKIYRDYGGSSNVNVCGRCGGIGRCACSVK